MHRIWNIPDLLLVIIEKLDRQSCVSPRDLESGRRVTQNIDPTGHESIATAH